MPWTPMNITVPVKAEVLLRFKGSEDLHLLGVVTYETKITLPEVGTFEREDKI